MQIAIYIVFFMMGAVFGSFFTLAVYRIPLHQDITHKRSYCPNCHHRLEFLDLIPILSYIFLRGKCRYCGHKIKSRYLILEVLSGLVFVLFALSIHMDFINIEVPKLMYLIFGILYISGLFIIAGIDKEIKAVMKELLIYETVVISIYMIYLCIFGAIDIYRYVMYLILLIFMVALDIYVFKRELKHNYGLECAILFLLIGFFSTRLQIILTAAMTLVAIAIFIILKKISYRRKKVKNKKKEKKLLSEIPVGYFLCVSNIISIILFNWVAFR